MHLQTWGWYPCCHKLWTLIGSICIVPPIQPGFDSHTSAWFERCQYGIRACNPLKII